jgi:hypothetical protein
VKISSEHAAIMARVLERYYIYANKLMVSGFSTHPESLRNNNLFIETADDLNIVAIIYPIFAGGRSIQEAVDARVQSSLLPDPKKPVASVPIVNVAPTENDILSLLGPDHAKEE